MEQYLQEPTIIEGDNLQANRWASSDLITTGNKFIERGYFKVKEWVEAGHLEPRHVPGKENPADLLTKIVDVPTQLKNYYSPIWIAMRWYKARAFMRHHKTLEPRQRRLR